MIIFRCIILGDKNYISTIFCRIIYNTIRKVKPKLVFACGNLALKMITKKSGIKSKRGSKFVIEVHGEEVNVVPLLHPTSVIIEPENRPLFDQDIELACHRIVLGGKGLPTFKF